MIALEKSTGKLSIPFAEGFATGSNPVAASDRINSSIFFCETDQLLGNPCLQYWPKTFETGEMAEKPISDGPATERMAAPTHYFHDHYKRTSYFLPFIPLTYKTVIVIPPPKKVCVRRTDAI